MKRSIVMIMVICQCTMALAQMNFHFLPEVYGRTIDGLGTFQVQNFSGLQLQGQVYISVIENNSKSKVVTIRTPLMTFTSGNNIIPKNVFSNSVFNFSGNSYASITSQTRQFPAGEYTFCFRFINSKPGGDDYENCFDASVQPMVPINLLSPADQEEICQKRPVLSWQPPIPFHASMRFRLMLTEKRQADAAESIFMRAPLVLVDNISSTTINYPSYSPDLKEGKTYCWQVIVYQKGIVVSKSEIWEFTVQCREPSKKPVYDSYRELKLLANGNYYIANGFLKFSFQSNYNVKKLQYSIHDIESAMEKIKNAPEISIQPGLNKIDIDLTELDLKPGKNYLLRVYPFNEPAVEVRFIYQENENNNQ